MNPQLHHGRTVAATLVALLLVSLSSFAEAASPVNFAPDQNIASGDFLVNSSEVSGEIEFNSPDGIGGNTPSGFDGFIGRPFCHNDPVGKYDYLGLQEKITGEEVRKSISGLIYPLIEGGELKQTYTQAELDQFFDLLDPESKNALNERRWESGFSGASKFYGSLARLKSGSVVELALPLTSEQDTALTERFKEESLSRSWDGWTTRIPKEVIRVLNVPSRAMEEKARATDTSMGSLFDTMDRLVAGLEPHRHGNESPEAFVHGLLGTTAYAGGGYLRIGGGGTSGSSVLPAPRTGMIATPGGQNFRAVAAGAENLTASQSRVLAQLDGFGSQTIITKKGFGLNDLAALSARTGDEFAMFTTGGHRLIVRGDALNVPITPAMGRQLSGQGWRWSAHVHPDGVLRSSGADRDVLGTFGNGRSAILDPYGGRSLFSHAGDMVSPSWLPR